MKLPSLVVLGTLLAGCGPSMEPGGVMTPEQRLQEQERLAWEAEQEEKKRGNQDYAEDADVDEREEFDKKQAELEMKRATLSAVTCVDVVDGAKPQGIADVTVVFGNDGNVRDASISPPHADTQLGECILNAYRGIIVPPFREAEYTLPWQLDLTKKKEEKKDDKKKDGKKK